MVLVLLALYINIKNIKFVIILQDGDENVPNNENSDGEISFNVENTGATNGFSF